MITVPRRVAQKRWCTFVFSVSVLDTNAQACFKCSNDNTTCGSIPFGSIVPYNDHSSKRPPPAGGGGGGEREREREGIYCAHPPSQLPVLNLILVYPSRTITPT